MIGVIGKKYAFNAEQIGDVLCASFFFYFTLSTIQQFIKTLRMNAKGNTDQKVRILQLCVMCKMVQMST